MKLVAMVIMITNLPPNPLLHRELHAREQKSMCSCPFAQQAEKSILLIMVENQERAVLLVSRVALEIAKSVLIGEALQDQVNWKGLVCLHFVPLSW